MYSIDIVVHMDTKYIYYIMKESKLMIMYLIYDFYA